MSAQEEDERECAFCRSRGVTLAEYQRHSNTAPRLLCDLCASTDGGTIQHYPEQYDSSTRVLAGMLCFIGNEILKELRKESK